MDAAKGVVSAVLPDEGVRVVYPIIDGVPHLIPADASLEPLQEEDAAA